MRKERLSAGFGIALLTILLVWLTAPVPAQDDTMLSRFPPTTATITLTNDDISITPSQLDPGPVTFTIRNDSDKTRGVYVTGEDLAGTPLIRYSPRVMPGNSVQMNFWLYQGSVYTFRDYMSRSNVTGELFGSAYSTEVSIPSPFPIGRGPEFPLQTGDITITESGVQVSPETSDLGPVRFTVTNDSNRLSGVVITGLDRVGNPILRYSRFISPGESIPVSFWLYEGETYRIRDFGSRYISSQGRMQFGSTSSTMLTVREQ